MNSNDIVLMHTGDTHLDSAKHSKVNPRTNRHLAVESNQKTLQHLVDTAIEKEVDRFIIAGDLTSDGKPTAETYLMLAETLRPLVKAGIPIDLDEGNHEKIGVRHSHRTPMNVVSEMLGGEAKGIHGVNGITLKHYDKYEILSIPYPSKTAILSKLDKRGVNPTKGDGIVVRHVLNEVENLLEDRDDSIPLIITGHFAVDGIGLPGSEQDIANLMHDVVFPVARLESFNPAYVGLSHIHTPQKVGKKTYYAGSPNKLTFTDATDTKGGNLVTISGSDLTVEQVETPARGIYKFDFEKGNFDLNLQENDVVQLFLEEGESDISKTLKQKFEEAKANYVLKTRIKKEEAPKREVLPEKISTMDALSVHLKEKGIEEDRIDSLIAMAKNLEPEGASK